jgi:hypothetical protein
MVSRSVTNIIPKAIVVVHLTYNFRCFLNYVGKMNLRNVYGRLIYSYGVFVLGIIHEVEIGIRNLEGHFEGPRLGATPRIITLRVVDVQTMT